MMKLEPKQTFLVCCPLDSSNASNPCDAMGRNKHIRKQTNLDPHNSENLTITSSNFGRQERRLIKGRAIPALIV
jgi:hypothetical protein